jgi:2-polyprenyl-3-methyl-5-hydroxy-6-metoxy-1,4-benzoquinol methylase
MAPDLSQRAHLDEAMDSLASYEEYRECMLDLDKVSRLVLAHRPTLRFLNRVAARNPGKTLRILDVACGDGSMLRRIGRWAKRRGLAVELTGLDLNPWAIEVAHEFRPGKPRVRYVAGDVFAYAPEEAPDVILSAHFTHHLGEAELVRFLRWMEATVRMGWFVNDLHRHPNPYRMFRAVAAVALWHPVVVSDGLISIRRAFTIEDWARMTAEAGLEGFEIAEEFPARVTVTRLI